MPKNLIFLLTEILDWVRPPPFWQKNPKNSEFFSVNRNFGFGETPAPPFQIFSEKNQFFLNDASPKGCLALPDEFSGKVPNPKEGGRSFPIQKFRLQIWTS